MTRHLLQPTSHDAIYELPTLTHLHDPVRVPRDTDSDYLAAIKDQHAAPAVSPRKYMEIAYTRTPSTQSVFQKMEGVFAR